MRISVIIPVYNSSKTIERALGSVINQSIRPFEVIVINDGSTDDSLELIRLFVKQNKGFTFRLIDKKNGGVSSARNSGLRIAEGSLIAFLDSDDEWLFNKLEKQLSFFKKETSYSLVGGLIYKSSKKRKKEFREIKLSQLINKNYFQPSTVMLKKEVIEKIGFFDETQKYAEEGNYFMRIADSFRCGLINEQLIIYDNGKGGFGESGLSANLKEMEKGELKNLKFAYDSNYITLFHYVFSVFFSVLKYIRRILIVKINKLC
jgi:glycosyltransferase involved in cell wall biosynthesis